MRKIVALIVMAAMLLVNTSFAFAAADPYITIVNPANETTITSGNLLVSVKISKKATVKVSLYKNTGTDAAPAWQAVFANDSFTTKSNLSFYTRKVENVSSGKYRIKVDTIGSNGTAVYSTYSNVTVKEKAGADEKAVFNSNTGAATFLQSLLQSIFGS